MRFEVAERKPAAVIETSAGRYVVDTEGYAVAGVSDPAWDFLPMVSVSTWMLDVVRFPRFVNV